MDTVRIGIIGAGLRSGIAKYWHNPGGESVVVAASDVSMERLKKFQVAWQEENI